MSGDYEATCTRVEGWWAIHVQEVPAGFTQAANLEQAERLVARAASELGVDG